MCLLALRGLLVLLGLRGRVVCRVILVLLARLGRLARLELLGLLVPLVRRGLLVRMAARC